MGLDIVCNSVFIRVGGYSYVHLNRIDWIKATLTHLKNVIKTCTDEIDSEVCIYRKFPLINQTDNLYDVNSVTDYIANGDYENSEQLLILESNMKLYNNLYNTIVVKNSNDSDIDFDRINYKLFGNLKDYLFENKLAGLYWWVCHSDCEGCLSPGQAFDIINTLKLISIYFDDQNLFIGPNKNYDNYYLSPVFIESVEQNELIIFT